MGGFSLWHWLIVLLIVVLVFGTKRLKNVGQDLGEAMRGFKKGLKEDDAAKPEADAPSRPEDAAATPTATTAADENDHNRPAGH